MTTLIDRTVSDKTSKSNSAIRLPRVLCIDDDPDIHTNIELRMLAYEVEVEHAYYGMQGIVESLKSGPDLILTDMAMPNGDGCYLVEMIRNNSSTAAVPIIVLTGMRDPKLRERALCHGANVYLQKPVSFAELLTQMRLFIEVRAREDQDGKPTY